MGVYKKTSLTWNGRPVWQHTGETFVFNQLVNRDNHPDRFLFYNADWSRWVINDEVSNDEAYIRCEDAGLINIPPT